MTFFEQELRRVSSLMGYEKPAISRVIMAKQFIDREFTGAINLAVISREAMISRYHFVRLFRKVYGRTPLAYLTELRLDKSRELLAMGSSVKDTCYTVGFSSTTTFTALFRKHHGVSPRTYLEEKAKSKRSVQPGSPIFAIH